ncbi:MAG: L,D-transpeptidase [Candidatus Cloacimonetes bacterium]|nr:L,D-transpeptidase [Candidatus Cloacimonadota bacterium]
MKKTFSIISLGIILLFAGAVSSCKAKTADPVSQQQAGSEADSNAVIASMPDSTDLELAWANRQPRNIKRGYYITIFKSKFQLNLYRDGKLLHSFPVAVGKNPGDKKKAGDYTTPEGWYNVKNIKPSSGWSFDFQDGKGPIPGAYGPWFISLNTTRAQNFSKEGWTGIGIHGTHDPASIGTMVTAGCIRLDNANLQILKKELDQAPDLSQVQVDILP